MRCSKAQVWISRRADGVLNAALATRLDVHLERCGECRAYARTLAAIEFDQFEVPEPSVGFVDRLTLRLNDTPRQERWVLTRPTVFRPLAAGLGAAAAIVGFTVGSFLQLVGGPDSPPGDGTVELAAGDAIDPLAEESVESVLIAMLSNGEE